MYLHLELKSVPAGRRAEAVDRLTRLHGLMAAAPGFIDAQICAGLDDPMYYLVTRAWRDRDAHTAYRASPAQQEYARNRPPSLPWENLAVEEWLTIFNASGEGRSGTFVVRSLYAVAAGEWNAFIERRRKDGHAGGLVYARSYRALDGGDFAAGDSLVLERYAGRDNHDRDRKRIASDAGGLQLLERYEIVSETLPA